MTQYPSAEFQQQPSPNLVLLTYVIYGLHLFSAFTGVITSASVVIAFLLSWLSVVAVILNYVKRGATRGTFLESHFRWQIRTFWYALFWVVVGSILVVTVVGIPLAWVMFGATGIWVLYRMARGVLRLLNDQPMPLP